MKKILSVFLVLMVLLSACAPAVAGSPDYCAIGLRVAGVLSEMVQSRDYLRLFVRGDDLLDLLSSMFDTGDYGTPVAVYRLEQQDPRAWMESLMSEEELSWLNGLSPALQEQVFTRLSGIALMSTQINAGKGAEVLSVVSALQAMVREPALEEEKSVSFLFVFGKGVPVLVSFGWHQASGMFVALDPADVQSQDSLQAVLSSYGITVIPVNIF